MKRHPRQQTPNWCNRHKDQGTKYILSVSSLQETVKHFKVYSSVILGIFTLLLKSCKSKLKPNKQLPFPLLLDPGNHHSSLCFYEFDNFRYLIYKWNHYLFFLVLLRNSLHESLCRFKVYSMIVWFIYIVKWLPQGLANIHHLINNKKKEENSFSPCDENS